MNWYLKKIEVSKLKEWNKNPRSLTEKGLKDLRESITKFGLAEPIVCNSDFTICGGHGRKKVLEEMGIKIVNVYLPKKKLNQKQFEELNIRLNKNIAGEFDIDKLANEFELKDLLEWGFEEDQLDLSKWDDANDDSQLDVIPEPKKKAISNFGDLFLINNRHRVLCGDSIKLENVGTLMGGV